MIKILWSVDAFDEAFEGSGQVFENCVKFLKELPGPIEVEPVYVLSPEQLRMNLEFSVPATERYLPAAQKALGQKLKNLAVPGLKDPRVLVHSYPSVKGSTQMLSAHALMDGFDFILSGSHGRSGVERVLLGSFSEELLLSSKVPVVILGPPAEKTLSQAAGAASGPIKSVLFPTDYSESAYPVFERAVEFASKLGASMTVLHTLPKSIEPVIQSGVYLFSGGWVPFPVYYEKEMERLQAVGDSWKARVKGRGVQIQFEFDTENTSAPVSILKSSEKHQMIMMAAQSGRIASALLGSVTRRVARESKVPVWVFRAFQ